MAGSQLDYFIPLYWRNNLTLRKNIIKIKAIAFIQPLCASHKTQFQF